MRRGKLFQVMGFGGFFSLVMVFCVFAEDLGMKKANEDWVYFSDQVMGGSSEGKAKVFFDADEQFIRLQGNVTTANNGGFIQIRTSVSGLKEELNGVSLKIRGNGERYYVFIRTVGTVLPWQYYKADFPSKKEWAEIKLEFNKFVRSSAWLNKKIKPDSIKSIGIVAFGRDHNALIDVAYIQFF